MRKYGIKREWKMVEYMINPGGEVKYHLATIILKEESI